MTLRRTAAFGPVHYYYLVPVHHGIIGMQLAGSQHRRARAVGDDDPADQALELPRRVLLRACMRAFLLRCACLLAGAVPSCRS